MGRLTLRLPDTLHQRLTQAAGREGVSLNQYLLYLLTQGTGSPYAVRSIPADEVREQEHRYGELLAELGSATHEEIASVLAERTEVEPEAGLTASLIDQVRRRIQEKPARR